MKSLVLTLAVKLPWIVSILFTYQLAHAGPGDPPFQNKDPACERDLLPEYLDGVSSLKNSLKKTFSGIPGIEILDFDVIGYDKDLSIDAKKMFSRYSRWSNANYSSIEGFPFTLGWEEYPLVAAELHSLPSYLRKSFVVKIVPGTVQDRLPKGHSAIRWLEVLSKASKKRNTGVGFVISREFRDTSYEPVYLIFPSPDLLAAFIRVAFPGFDGNLKVSGFEGSAIGQTWPELKYEIDPEKQLGALRTLSSIAQILDEVLRASKDPKIEIKVNRAPGVAFSVGQVFHTPKGLRCKVVKEMESGSDRVVYRVKTDDGRDLIYKAARTRKQDHIDGIDKDAERAREMERLGLPHARLIEHEPGTGYLLREYTEGIRGDEWLEAWAENNGPSKSRELLDLIRLFKQGIEKRVYIGKLDPEDAIYQKGRGWVVVDSGRVKEEYSEDEVILMYAIRTTELWSAKIRRDKLKQKFEKLIQDDLLKRGKT